MNRSKGRPTSTSKGKDKRKVKEEEKTQVAKKAKQTSNPKRADSIKQESSSERKPRFTNGDRRIAKQKKGKEEEKEKKRVASKVSLKKTSKSPRVHELKNKEEKDKSIPPKSNIKSTSKQTQQTQRIKPKTVPKKKVESPTQKIVKKVVSKMTKKGTKRERSRDDDELLITNIKSRATKKQQTPKKKSKSAGKSTEKKQQILTSAKQQLKEETAKKEKIDPASSEGHSEEANEKRAASTSGMNKKKAIKGFSYETDSQGISKEIERFIKKIEDKKKAKGEFTMLGKKHERKPRKEQALKSTAKDYNYVLQRNPNLSPVHFINLAEINAKTAITNTEILLALVEIAANSSYYVISFSNRSKMFWEDIVQYNELKHIFDGYKPETLRKYWMILSRFDAEKICDLIKQKKKFLETIPIKLRTIVNTLAQFFEGKITDVEEYIKNMHVDIRKQEIFEQEYRNPETGEITTVKDVRTTIRKRKRYEVGHKRQFLGKNYEGQALDEIYGDNENETKYQNVMKKLSDEDSSKFKYLQQFTDDEKKKLLSITEDDKFIFKVIDNVLDELTKEFRNFTRDYIMDVLIANSMSIGRTYQTLSDSKDKAPIFTAIDDDVIRKMKGGEQYKKLVNEKGKNNVDEREEFLKS